MTLYWKQTTNKLELLAEPAARCLTVEFKNHRWSLSCLGETMSWSGNFTAEDIKAKALEWFSGALRRLAEAVTTAQG